jgi:hypothetical protein
MEKKTTTPQLITEIQNRRGMVSTNFAFIEFSIAQFVASYYCTCEKSDFLADVFEDEYFSFGLLMNVFEKVLKKEPDLYEKFPLQKLRRLQKMRNLIVHARLQTQVILDNKKGGIQEVGETYFYHAGKEYEVNEVLKEYEKLKNVVQPAIIALPGANQDLERVEFHS